MAIGDLEQWKPYYDKRGGVPFDTAHGFASIQIDDTDSLSEEIDMGGFVAVRFVIPAGFPGAVLTFQSSLHGNSDYQNVYYNGIELSIAVGASQDVIVPPEIAAALYPFIKIRSGTAASPSVVTGDTQIGILGMQP